MNIVFLSHSFRNGPFKVGSYHLSREFAQRGHDVYHVSTPVSLLHLALRRNKDQMRAARSGPTQSDDGVIDYVPLTPFPARWWWSQRSLARVLRRLGSPRVDICFVDQPLIAGRMPTGTITVLRPTDVKTTRRAQRRADTVMRSWADGLAATSPTVLQSLANPRSIPAVVVENGVEIARFLEPSSRAARSGFVYVGALDSRFDFETLLELSRALPGETFDIYGPASRAAQEALGGAKNITVHGAIDYAAVPALLRRARVGLLPFTRSASNTGRSPMKLYEYLASGLVVLSSEEARIDIRLSEFCVSYDSAPGDAIRAARQALSMTGPDSSALRVVAENDWGNKAERLLDFAASLVGEKQSEGK